MPRYACQAIVQAVSSAALSAAQQTDSVLRWCGACKGSSNEVSLSFVNLLESSSRNPEPVTDFRVILQKRFASSIKNCMDDEDFGVYVVWAPPQSCKTTYTKCMLEAWRLQNCQTNCYVCKDTYSPNPNEWLAELHVKSCLNLAHQLQAVQKQLVIVYDQFDRAFDVGSLDQIQSIIQQLAAASQEYKTFRVVLNVQSCIVADEILRWSQNQNIKLAADVPDGCPERILDFRWQRSEAIKFLGSEANTWTKENFEQFVDVACKCNMRTLKLVKQEPWRMVQPNFNALVTQEDLAWHTGIAYLMNHKTRHKQQESQEEQHTFTGML